MLPSLGYIPSSIMIPPRRMAVLITQAQAHQRQQCTYHNAPLPGALPGVPGDSLYVDHECDMAAFPRVTTLILDEHNDEVWNLSWNHAGTLLATGGSDKRAIVWKIGVSTLLSVICEQRLTEPT
jgi:WD repeat-containing protein 26